MTFELLCVIFFDGITVISAVDPVKWLCEGLEVGMGGMGRSWELGQDQSQLALTIWFI